MLTSLFPYRATNGVLYKILCNYKCRDENTDRCKSVSIIDWISKYMCIISNRINQTMWYFWIMYISLCYDPFPYDTWINIHGYITFSSIWPSFGCFRPSWFMILIPFPVFSSYCCEILACVDHEWIHGSTFIHWMFTCDFLDNVWNDRISLQN